MQLGQFLELVFELTNIEISQFDSSQAGYVVRTPESGRHLTTFDERSTLRKLACVNGFTMRRFYDPDRPCVENWAFDPSKLSMETTVYHATPDFKISKILAEGLNPGTAKEFSGDCRLDCEGNIYFADVLGDQDDANLPLEARGKRETAYAWARTLYDHVTCLRWAMLKVDLSNFADGYLVEDPCAGEGGRGLMLACSSCVPISRIKLLDTFEIARPDAANSPRLGPE